MVRNGIVSYATPPPPIAANDYRQPRQRLFHVVGKKGWLRENNVRYVGVVDARGSVWYCQSTGCRGNGSGVVFVFVVRVVREGMKKINSNYTNYESIPPFSKFKCKRTSSFVAILVSRILRKQFSYTSDLQMYTKSLNEQTYNDFLSPSLTPTSTVQLSFRMPHKAICIPYLIPYRNEEASQRDRRCNHGHRERSIRLINE